MTPEERTLLRDIACRAKVAYEKCFPLYLTAPEFMFIRAQLDEGCIEWDEEIIAVWKDCLPHVAPDNPAYGFLSLPVVVRTPCTCLPGEGDPCEREAECYEAWYQAHCPPTPPVCGCPAIDPDPAHHAARAPMRAWLEDQAASARARGIRIEDQVRGAGHPDSDMQ
jgi:hypothetical protein